MDEQRQEQASSYALGVLPEGERAEFEQALARDPELQQLVRDLQDALGEAARSLPATRPPPALKARVMEKIGSSKGARDPAPTVARFPVWIAWTAAACLALAAGGLAYDRARLRLEKSQVELAVQTMAKEAEELRIRAQAAASDAENLRQRVEAFERTIAGLRTELASAQSAANLATMQVARLASLVADQPQAMGVSLWNDSTKQGVLLVENLPLPPAGKTYEFWVIDPALGAPVSAGIFTTDADGRGRIVFRPRSGVRTAAQFAISIEQAGGSTVAGPQGPVIMAGATTQL